MSINEEKVEKKVGKLYKRFIGPNSVGVSKNLENGIKKALRIAVIQNSKRHAHAVGEEVRSKILGICEEMALEASFGEGTNPNDFMKGFVQGNTLIYDRVKGATLVESVASNLEE